ncbi:hypothetical protein [Azospirillum doebereinerae]|uniref:DUF945 family protein n=1 Tax=Azospirillum doebereinerae TaxID=92933 RepID=A0A3S0WTQ4_9PROT|nr:hypothetical protein [Azospirillum doebereinerae]MCG5240570.1 hypothetical protein [Azospirillum doebereinerae]RUQ68456.1 hypothetical protein EJ913_17660 [Azospirillum doebereinerae]
MPPVHASQPRKTNRLAVGGAVVLALAAAAGGGYVYAQGEADKRLAAHLDAVRAGLPPGASLTYDSAKASLLSRGATLTKLALKIDGRIEARAERVTASGAGENTLDAFDAETVTVGNPNTAETVSLKRLRLEGIDARAVAARLGGDLGRMQAADLKDVRWTRATANGVVQLDAKDQRTVRIEDAEAEQKGEQRQTHLTLKTVEVAEERGDKRRLTVNRVELSARAADLMDGASPAGGVKADTIGAVSVDRLAMTAGGAAVVSVGHAEYTANAAPGSAGLHVKTTVKDLEIPQSSQLRNGEFADAAATMKELGYDTLLLNVAAEMKHDGASRSGSFGPITLSGDRIGSLETSAEMLEFDLPRSGEDIPGLASALLKDLRISYTDRSLMERSFKAIASRQNVSVEALKAEASANVDRSLARLSPRDPGIAAALKSFIAKPGTLELSVTPVKPMNSTQIAFAGMLAPERLSDIVAIRLVAR